MVLVNHGSEQHHIPVPCMTALHQHCFRAPPGTGNELIAYFRSILPETGAYEGCLGADTLQNSDDADNLVLVETWETHEQYEKYLAWRRGRGDSDRLREGLAEPPNIRHFEVADA
ncbi:MAG: hypothetical protein F4206_10725 [Gammaproteobacteria bacterium]|nr:hypothetical protein [Gammaproteobacteria bacterium]MYG67180.1 hypothetical protein [Gammaproteobacteria bacterium]